MKTGIDIGHRIDDLHVALQAEVRVTHFQQFGIDRAVHRMADSAPVTHSFMLEHVRAPLGVMAFKAGLIFTH